MLSNTDAFFHCTGIFFNTRVIWDVVLRCLPRLASFVAWVLFLIPVNRGVIQAKIRPTTTWVLFLIPELYGCSATLFT